MISSPPLNPPGFVLVSLVTILRHCSPGPLFSPGLLADSTHYPDPITDFYGGGPTSVSQTQSQLPPGSSNPTVRPTHRTILPQTGPASCLYPIT